MFIKKREKEIKNLNIKFQEFEHKCGTKHYHFSSKDIENSFLIAFPTLPQTSDGRAHILEHLALCGSEKFNTHDPFFAMTRRSLASFMNAMTYPEKTVYPFSTSDKKDYFNLLSVYLDATFFPKLDYYNFLQEGWRYEFNEKGELEYGGVVYNEMKGALSDKYYHVYRSIQKELKPGTIYCNESGGDPLEIPNLKYEELISFHNEFYHPSRATIMTYGDINVSEIQDFFEKEVISKISTKFDRVLPQKSHFDKSQLTTVKQHYFPASKEDQDSEYMLIINWILGLSEETMTEDYKILSHILLSDGGKLCNEIDNAGFGRPSAFNGTLNGYESSFHMGFEGLKKHEIEKAKNYLFDILADVAKTGVDKKVIDSTLDDIELDIKNLNSSNTPYGLKILFKGVEHAVNEQDPLFGIDFEEKFEQARKRFADKDYVKLLVNNLLNKIPKVVVEFVPKADFFDVKNKMEKERLVYISEKLSAEEKEKIKLDSQKLKEKQTQKHNYDCLPKINSSDVSAKIKKDLKVKSLNEHNSLSYFKIPSNGISSVDFIFNLKDFEENDWARLQLLLTLLVGMPSKNKSWKNATKHRNILSKNYHIVLNAFNDIENPHSGKLVAEFSISHLDRKSKNILKLANEFFFNISFSNFPRIKQIIKQEIADFEQNLSHIGNEFASHNVAKEFSFSGRFDQKTGGLDYLKYLKDIYHSFSKKDNKEAFMKEMAELYEKVMKSPAILFGAGSSKVEKLLLKSYKELNLNWNKSNVVESKHLNIDVKNIKEAYISDTEVNYCHQAFETKGLNFRNPKSTCLDLAARLITHNYLHPVIREQNGAYGAGAKFNIFENMFAFYSYRDPNFEKTYNAYEQIHDWFINHEFTEDQLEEAKLSLLQVLEKPMTPKNEYNKNIVYHLIGITEEDRLKRKKFILNATLKDIVQTYKECINFEKTAKSAFLSKNTKNKFDFEFKKIK